MSESFLGGRVILHCGDCREVLKGIPDNSIDSAAMDPPYALVSIQKRFGKPGSAPAKGNDAYMRASAGFMSATWDTGETAFAYEFWAEVLRVLKPGAHLVAFSGTRTYHRMAVAIEDAGFEIRDQLGWLYGSGFPKSQDVALFIDKSKGIVRVPSAVIEQRVGFDAEAEGGGGWSAGEIRISDPVSDEAKQWDGWGTAVKPAWEPIVLARKPLSEKTVAANVLRWGTGALNIDGCRVGDDVRKIGLRDMDRMHGGNYAGGGIGQPIGVKQYKGRFPANIIHDGSPEVLAAFPANAGAFAPVRGTEPSNAVTNVYGERERVATVHHGDMGSAARFFYSSKADGDDRLGSKHPTVKPVDLMQWLARLVTPPGGTVLDAFAGTGTTGEAAWREGFTALLIEREPEYQNDIRKRMALALGGSAARKRAHKKKDTLPPVGGMFDDDSDTPPRT